MTDPIWPWADSHRSSGWPWLRNASTSEAPAKGEDYPDALRRELLEDLGCVQGPVGDELFQWHWHGVQPAQNHFFSVRCDVADEALALNEGQAMGWFSLDELPSLPTRPLISDNIRQIYRFIESQIGKA